MNPVIAIAGIVLAAAGSVELFTSIPAQFRRDHLRYEKRPTYIECHADAVTVWPGGARIPVERLRRADHDLRPLLDEIETNAASRYLVLVQRPGSAGILPAVRRAIYLRRIEVAHELIDATTPLLEAVERPEFVAGALAKPVDQKPVFFECRANEVFFANKDELGAEVMAFINQYRPLSRREDLELMEKRLRQVKFGDEFYEIDGVDYLMGKITLRPQPDSHGETPQQLDGAESAFLARLRRLNPKRHYAQFLVRDDSLEVMRAARDAAEKRGFEWRVSLLESNAPLQFAP